MLLSVSFLDVILTRTGIVCFLILHSQDQIVPALSASPQSPHR